MVEVRDIGEDETPPPDADWVLIEKAGLKFRANGSASGKIEATFFTPAPFDSEQDAVRESVAWAEANDVPTVYVRTGPAPATKRRRLSKWAA